MPEKLLVPTRNEEIANYERDYRLRLPGARVGSGTLPGIDARCLTDQLLPLYAEAGVLADDASLDSKSLADLRVLAQELGLPDLLPAVGASGSVTVTTSVGGATILAGTLALYEPTGKRYQCTVTAVYTTGGTPVPVACVDTGPETNLDPGATLKWQSPPPGLAQDATVFEDGAGRGLFGGRAEESRSELAQRISDELANPAVAANSAAYIRAARETQGVAVQQPFVYPCAPIGPGTLCMAFTLRPSKPGGSRVPNSTQKSLVRANVVGQMPADDSLFMLDVVEEDLNLALAIRWAPGTVGWIDPSPWPPWNSDALQRIYVTAYATPTTTSCVVGAASGTPTPPQVGQTLSLWSVAAGRFVAKRIATVTATFDPGTNWLLTFDATNAASDTSYVPVVGDWVMPWSDLLGSLSGPLIDAVDQLGPGELYATPFDNGGRRQKREPASPGSWSSSVTGRITLPVYSIPTVDEVQVLAPALPNATTVGAPGVSVKLKRLASLAVYPL